MPSQWIFAVLAIIFTGTAAVGAVVPGLPTVPFLLLAVGCGRRGCPGLARRIEQHPRWGRVLRDWHARRAVPRRAKYLAAAGMTASVAWLVSSGAPGAVVVPVAALLAVVLVWLWRRPDAKPLRQSGVAG